VNVGPDAAVRCILRQQRARKQLEQCATSKALDLRETNNACRKIRSRKQFPFSFTMCAQADLSTTGMRACKPSFIRRHLPSFELLDLQKTKRTLLRVSGHKKCSIWRCADARKMVGNDQGYFCFSSDPKVGIDVKSAIIQPVQYSNSAVLHNHLRCPPLNSYKYPTPSKYHTSLCSPSTGSHLSTNLLCSSTLLNQDMTSLPTR
jgi:hypothetical protein